MLEIVPYTITGPAIMKIFAPTPKTNPSLLESMAQEQTAFAKPVIGTRVPAFALAAILSKTPKPVKRQARKIRAMGITALVFSFDMSSILHMSPTA